MMRCCANLQMVLMLALTGCGTSISYMPTNPPPRPLAARPFVTVEVFTASKPARPFVEIGLIEAQQESACSRDAPAEVLIKLREEAARVGCDGIILLGANDSVVGQSGMHGNGGYTATLKGYRAACFCYRDPAPAGAQSPPPPPPPPAQSVK